MNKLRYNIKIDDIVMPQSFTYEELLLNDVLEFEDIEIKETSKSNWSTIRGFYFPEEYESDKFYIDGNGQVHINQPSSTTAQPNYEIDDYGQIIQHNNLVIPSSTHSSYTSNNSSNTSTDSSDNGVFWKIIISIFLIAICIVFFNAGFIIGSIATICCIMVLRAIWKRANN
jgi:hypothetical protein